MDKVDCDNDVPEELEGRQIRLSSLLPAAVAQLLGKHTASRGPLADVLCWMERAPVEQVVPAGGLPSCARSQREIGDAGFNLNLTAGATHSPVGSGAFAVSSSGADVPSLPPSDFGCWREHSEPQLAGDLYSPSPNAVQRLLHGLEPVQAPTDGDDQDGLTALSSRPAADPADARLPAPASERNDFAGRAPVEPLALTIAQVPADDGGSCISSEEDGGVQTPPRAATMATLSAQLSSPASEVSPLELSRAPVIPPEAISMEEEWLERKKLTGAIGRLVHYSEGQRPERDILGFYRTRHQRVLVTGVQKDGPAARAGVSPGDQLVSINGGKSFEAYPASAILSSLRAPVTLVFLGFAGKLQAEVRVRQPDQPQCGLPVAINVATHSRVVTGSNGVKLCDAVVFPAAASSLLIATGGCEEKPEKKGEAAGKFYELQREDARGLLKRALKAAPPDETLAV